MKRKLAVAACLWAGGFGVASARTLEAIPDEVIVDESAAIHPTGLQANQRASI